MSVVVASADKFGYQEEEVAAALLVVLAVGVDKVNTKFLLGHTALEVDVLVFAAAFAAQYYHLGRLSLMVAVASADKFDFQEEVAVALVVVFGNTVNTKTFLVHMAAALKVVVFVVAAFEAVVDRLVAYLFQNSSREDHSFRKKEEAAVREPVE